MLYEKFSTANERGQFCWAKKVPQVFDYRLLIWDVDCQGRCKAGTGYEGY